MAVIATLSSQPATLAAKAATTTVPIVFTWPGDPVASGLVGSLSRPGGNATGINTLSYELAARRPGPLRALAPKATAFFVLLNPADPGTEKASRDLQATARTVGVELQNLYAGSDGEIDAAFATLASKPGGALLVNADPFLFIRRAQIAALAARHAVSAIYYDREFAVSGGLMSYGADLPIAWGQAGAYVARILKCEKTGRAAGRAAVEVRAGDRPQDRHGARPRGAVGSALHRRRSDRMKRRASMLLLGVATTAWPFSAGAQQRSMPEAGHVEGQNVAVEYRWADDQYDRAPAMAADRVDRKVDVITTIGAHLTVAMSPMSLAS